MLVLAISKRPPGNVGIGNKETQPKKLTIAPALDKGWDQTIFTEIPSAMIGLNKLTNKGISATYCIEVISTKSGVSNKPKIHKDIPEIIKILGTIRALQPNSSRSFQGLASILGSVGIIRIPNGQINIDFDIRPSENKLIDGSGIGVK